MKRSAAVRRRGEEAAGKHDARAVQLVQERGQGHISGSAGIVEQAHGQGSGTTSVMASPHVA